jgi:sec-independent protein translocase protein TatB
VFNVGAGEMVVVFLLALIVLGPERLPKAMGQVGRYVAQMRKLSSGFQDEIRRAMDPMDAPFRPGEQTLSGPVPAVTDEVKVVASATETDPDPAPEAAAAEPVDLAKPGAPVQVEPPEGGTVTPLRPRSDDGDRAAG